MNLFEKTGAIILVSLMSKGIVKLFGDDFYSTRQDYDPAEKQIVNKLILAIPSFGCSHYFKNGGCAMCAFNKEIENYHFRQMHPKMLFFLIRAFLTFLEIKIRKEELRPEVLIVFMAGSFINEEELPIKAQDLVIDFFLANNFKKLAIETRSEYVLKKKKRIREITQRLKFLKFEVYLGLEAVDDKIRNRSIKKNLSRKEYEQSVKLLRGLRVIVNTYILLGAPYLSRKEVVEESYKSAVYAFDSGSNVVSLEAYCVQAGTFWAKLYEKKKLRLLTLWDIIEVVKRIDKVSPNWYLGKFADWPKPIAVPGSCEKCAPVIMNFLFNLRRTHRLSALPDCNCRN